MESRKGYVDKLNLRERDNKENYSELSKATGGGCEGALNWKLDLLTHLAPAANLDPIHSQFAESP